MKIAFILPSLKNQGPVIVAKDIIEGLINEVAIVDVYYYHNLVKNVFNDYYNDEKYVKAIVNP